jgi:hypothetical protein
MHDVLLGRDGGVLWSIPETKYIQGSFWKLNLSLYHEVLRLDSLFRENGVRGKYDLQSIFAVMAWGEAGAGAGAGGRLAPYYDGPSRVENGSMLVIGENFMPWVMNGLGVWDTKNGVGDHVNMESLENFWWGASASQRRDEGAVDIDRRLKLTDTCSWACADLRTSVYPDKEIHILSLTFDSFFASNISGSDDFARLFPFLIV